MTTATDWLVKAREVLDIEAQGLVAVRDRLGPSFVQALEILAGCEGRTQRRREQNKLEK